MNAPESHASAAWRTPGGVTIHGIRAAIMAYNEELQADRDEARTTIENHRALLRSIRNWMTANYHPDLNGFLKQISTLTQE